MMTPPYDCLRVDAGATVRDGTTSQSATDSRMGAGQLAAPASSRRSEASPRAAVTRAPVYRICRKLCPKKLI